MRLLGPLVEFWRIVSHAGVVSPEASRSRQIILTNRISILLLVLSILITIGFLVIDTPQSTINWCLALTLITVSVPTLNWYNKPNASRYILGIVLPIAAVVFTAKARYWNPDIVHEGSFYISRYFQIAFSFIPVVVFGFDERHHLIKAFTINILILLFYNDLLDIMDGGLGVSEAPISDPFFVSISSVISLLIISGGYFFLGRINRDYELKIESLLSSVETQNRNMHAAVTYATSIQQVILPPKQIINSLKHCLFSIYKPLHTVSGDFFLIKESGDLLFFSVVDCTGHGVPGAFMSILANSALERSIDQVGLEKPEQILNMTNQIFHDDLLKSGNPDIRDGMDLILCVLNRKTDVLNFAGANLALYVSTQQGLTEMKTSKGGLCLGNPERIFESAAIKLADGDCIYISSDGYYDQFGGPEDKKMGRRRFRDKLRTLKPLSIEQQEKVLTSYFNEWSGESPQVDDVCVIGFHFIKSNYSKAI